jgi:DNA-directed RNA polymerase subunit L
MSEERKLAVDLHNSDSTVNLLTSAKGKGSKRKMQVQTTSEGDKGLTVEITGEDYSLAEIVHCELLEDKSVTFAGVVPSHPLIKKLIIKVRAQRIKPEKAFVSSIQRAIDTTDELYESIDKAFGGRSG